MNKVVEYLKNKKIHFRTGVYSSAVKSAEEAASQINLNTAQMVKSLLVKAGETYVLCLLPTPSKLNFDKVSTLLTLKAEMASKETIAEVTGYFIGTVSPFSLKEPLQIYIDKSVFRYKEIGVGSGEKGIEIIISPKDLLELTNGMAEDLS